MRLPSYNYFRKKNDHTLPGSSNGVRVNNNNVEMALKIFKRKIKDTEVLIKVRENRFFVKKSHTKRLQNEHAILIQKRMSKEDRDSKLF